MATHDYVIANGTGAAVRSDLNNALAAIVSNNSSSSEPSTTYAYQWWADTNANVLKIRNSANNAWITLRELDGTMLIEDGSASTPGLAFADDVNTGIFSPAADQIGFATGGAERLEIGSSEVVFNDPSNDVDFRVESNGNTHMLFVDAGNDRVGIGTSSPAELLEIRDGHISVGSSTNTTSTNTLISGYGYVISGSKFGNVSIRSSYVNTTNAAGLEFYVASPTVSEAMRLDSSGRLLVGTTSAGAGDAQYSKVQIIGNSLNNEGFFRIGRNENTSSMSSSDVLGRIFFTDGSGDRYGQIDCICDGTPGSNDFPGRLSFSTTADGASSPTEYLRITAAGAIATQNGGHFNGTNNGDVPFTNAPIVLQNTSNNTNATMIQFKGYNGSQSGSISTRVNVTTYSTSSDYRLKENVVAIADGITRVKQLAPKRFNFIGYDDTTCDGFLAHEAQAVVPEAVVGTHNEVDGDGNAVMQSIDQSKLVPLLTAALQEAIAKIETLETKVAALEAG